LADVAVNVRSRTFGAPAFVDRIPVSDGICRRLGRARNAACRSSRSIRCRPQETPSARKRPRTLVSSCSLALARALGDRVRQA
jgi:hypothetical protein